MLTYDIESKYEQEGYKVICGCDEAGRGPLAGPVVAAAVVLPIGLVIEGLNDSKKISEKKREKLFEIIKSEAVAYSISSASVEEIGEYNILGASLLAMKRAVAGLSVKADLALIDGNIARGFDIDAVPVVKGDSLSPSIAAASILAKVTRDRMLVEYDKEYPEYNFKKHKGYPTKLHRDLVMEFGPCPLHRLSFLKFMHKENG